ncbi:hypothetical protein HID58_042949 [Brassica napus]|uniref:Uncharacterized protein n=1 Tax=Brassica napus TaxID=3708 RepID=A0ABQ8BF55_BRANA|nr:hypothetical protein HID58_042949 [Brassica napus]
MSERHPTLPEEEERDTYLVAANDKLNPDPVEEEEDVNLAEEQDGDANCVEEKEEDVSSSEEEEDANYEKNSVEEEGEIGSEERSSHETWVVDDIQSLEEQRDKDEGRSSRTLNNCGDTKLVNGKDKKWKSGQKKLRGMHETRCIGSLCEGSR